LPIDLIDISLNILCQIIIHIPVFSATSLLRIRSIISDQDKKEEVLDSGKEKSTRALPQNNQIHFYELLGSSSFSPVFFSCFILRDQNNLQTIQSPNYCCTLELTRAVQENFQPTGADSDLTTTALPEVSEVANS